jgi:transposase
MLLSEGQMSDYKGAALMLPAMPKVKQLLADKGYDADWFRAALAKRGVAACIPSKSNRKVAIPYDALLYKQRHKIENMFGRLKDWRRIHMCPRCQRAFTPPRHSAHRIELTGESPRRAEANNPKQLDLRPRKGMKLSRPTSAAPGRDHRVIGSHLLDNCLTYPRKPTRSRRSLPHRRSHRPAAP